MNQQPTPSQQNQIRKAKAILWLGITVIIVSGLLVAVYFVFLVGGERNSNSNTISNANVAINTNTTISDTVQFPDAEVLVTCEQNDDCKIADITESLSDCCPTPDCINWYVDDQYKAVNKESYNHERQKLTQENNCEAKECPDYSAPYCPPDEPYAKAECKNNICTKITIGDADSSLTDWQTYEDAVNGYAMKYPANYLIKMETDYYVVFDNLSFDTPGTTYLHISVTAVDNDFHTYRLGVLTNSAVDNESPISEDDVTIDGLEGKKITLKNNLGETIIHYLVAYLGKVYDISAGDSVGAEILNAVVMNFNIDQLDDSIDISDASVFTDKACVSNNDCGAFPCLNGQCLVLECGSDSDCAKGTCGQYVTPVPGYCTTMDTL